MKHILILLVLSGVTSAQALAQVHLKGQRFIELQAGLTDGFHLNRKQVSINTVLSTGRYNRQYNAWKLSFSFVQKNFTPTDSSGLIPMRQYAVGWGYEVNLWRNATRTRFVRGIFQPTLLYESVGVRQVSASDTARRVMFSSRFLLGGDVGLDVELSPVVISIRQRWQPKSSVQPFHTLFLLGWRFH